MFENLLSYSVVGCVSIFFSHFLLYSASSSWGDIQLYKFVLCMTDFFFTVDAQFKLFHVFVLSFLEKSATINIEAP